ncbi:MAG: hypothetical protein ACP5O1_11955 [Phycisphaerae bacterium]
MAKLNQDQIRKLALQIIAERPGGVRYAELVREIVRRNAETPQNTVHGSVWDLATRYSDKVIKPSRGLFQSVSAEGQPVEPTVVEANHVAGASEKDFYEPFAEWLKNDLDEVTVAKSLGGAGLKTKWGTPDVIGVYKPTASNLIKFPIEIVSAEIKTDPQESVVAFGQAVAYRLFSAKTYVVMPNSISRDDQSRLESLCMLFGVGLVLFDNDPKEPDFTISVRAQRYLPDMFYVNEFADRLKQHNTKIFEDLFA